MSAIPRAKPYSPEAMAALDAKALPLAEVLARMSPREQRVVVAYATLSHHRRSAAPKAKKTLAP